ncbi:NUDIX domain protein [compost metagenome]
MEEVAKRELFEETGLIAGEINLLDVFSGMDLYYQYPHGDEVYNVVVAYICREYQGNISRDEKEVKDIKFFNIQDIPSEISPPDLPVINKFLKKMRDVV